MLHYIVFKVLRRRSFVSLTCDSFVSIPLVFSFVNSFFQIFFSFFLNLKNPQSVGFSGRPTP